MLEKGEGETPSHSLAKPLGHVFSDVRPGDLPLGLPPNNDIEHHIDLLPIPSELKVSRGAELKLREIKELHEQIRSQKENVNAVHQARKSKHRKYLEFSLIHVVALPVFNIRNLRICVEDNF